MTDLDNLFELQNTLGAPSNQRERLRKYSAADYGWPSSVVVSSCWRSPRCAAGSEMTRTAASVPNSLVSPVRPIALALCQQPCKLP